MFLHLTWLFRRFKEENAHDEAKVEVLSEKRDRVVGIFKSLAIQAPSNARESVRGQVSPAVSLSALAPDLWHNVLRLL